MLYFSTEAAEEEASINQRYHTTEVDQNGKFENQEADNTKPETPKQEEGNIKSMKAKKKSSLSCCLCFGSKVEPET